MMGNALFYDTPKVMTDRGSILYVLSDGYKLALAKTFFTS